MTVFDKPRRRFRFTLRTMFVGVTLFCAWLGLYSMYGEVVTAVTLACVYVLVVIAWCSVLIDCARNERKLHWPMILLFGGIPGVLLYIFYRRPRRLAEVRGGQATDKTGLVE